MREKYSMLAILAIVLIVGTAMVVPGCITNGSPSNTPASTTPTVAPSDGPKAGGTLKMAYGELVPDLSPYNGFFTGHFGIYETLFYFDENMALQPGLATKYEAINDTAYRITLRQGVKFQDGSLMNADAVVLSLNKLISADNPNRAKYDFIDTVYKDSDNSVIIKTKTTYAPTIASLTLKDSSILSPNTKDPLNAPIGTGPFKVSSFTPKVSLSVVRFDDYWGGKPYLDGAVFQFSEDEQSRVYMVENNEVDMTHWFAVTKDTMASLSNNKNVQLVGKEAPAIWYLLLNTKKAPLNDVNVRQAIDYAISRDQVVEVGTGSFKEPAMGIFPPSSPWASKSLNGHAYNQQKAKDLLAKAGLKDTNGDGWLDYNGNTVELNIMTYDFDILKPSIEVMQQQLQAVGIKTTLKVGGYSAGWDAVKKGDFDLWFDYARVLFTGDPDSILYSLLAYSDAKAPKSAGYSSPEMDSLIQSGRTTIDESQRHVIYDKIQQKILDDTYIIPVLYDVESYAINNRVGGFKAYPTGNKLVTKDMYIKQ